MPFTAGSHSAPLMGTSPGTTGVSSMQMRGSPVSVDTTRAQNIWCSVDTHRGTFFTGPRGQQHGHTTGRQLLPI
ncbi:predicted protein [Histoplasma mississippiense (nom. inval.)]|uniref:predicted protein n=2 Tax=Ajellomyces capsulatus (strain NAm1 / WU24) TaxID=2059318 RepID=UPI000157B9B6|nr:predicted protein [Histoplasma mississippiense (nom. inval.)]EDN03369.1 predicted protein [Histoplasma mississippiense (nom. inval.)]